MTERRFPSLVKETIQRHRLESETRDGATYTFKMDSGATASTIDPSKAAEWRRLIAYHEEDHDDIESGKFKGSLILQGSNEALPKKLRGRHAQPKE